MITDPSAAADRGPQSVADSLRPRVVEELQALEEDVLWTEKAHFARAETLGRANFWVGLVATVSAAGAAGTIVAERSQLVAGLAALVAAIASGLLTFLKPLDGEKRHLDAGRQLGALRVRVRQAIRLDLTPEMGATAGDLRGLVRSFAEAKAKIDADAPATSGRAFQAARKKIEAGHFQHAASPPTP